MISEITFVEWSLGVGFFVSTFGFVVTLIRWLQERREKLLEHAKSTELADELREIQRRGRAPYLQASFLHVPPIAPRGNKILQFGEAVIPDEIDPGTVLRLDLSNDGEEVRSIDDDWASPEGFEVRPQGIPRDSSRAATILYRYDRSKHGTPMRITLFFETQDGLKLHQIYETMHGVCCLRRIDPA